MKTFQQFCEDANLKEFWWLANEPPVKPQPPKQEVLAYKNYKSGTLNKSTGKFTQRSHTGPEQKRYGWKPVEVSAYDPTGNPTASGKPFTQSTPPSVAVPWKSKEDKRPKIEFGTKVDFTNKPSGATTKRVTADVTDTGNFGRPDKSSVNPKTSFDISPTLRQRLKPGSTTTSFGKPMVYAKVAPSQKPNK